MLGDRLAEGLALLRVAQRQLERALGEPDAAGGDVHAPEVERVHHLHEALVQALLFAAEDVLGRAAIAVEHELGGLDALVAHLLDLRAGR